MRIISFNVNGIRSMASKTKDGIKGCEFKSNVLSSLTSEKSPDILCLQEIKTVNHADLLGYSSLYSYIYTNVSKARKGYSGVAMLSKHKPTSVHEDFNYVSEEVLGIEYTKYPFVQEGRMLTALFPTATIVCVYTPNSKDKLTRLEERLIWDSTFAKYVKYLESSRSIPVIICGDLNCAHKAIDLHNPKTNLRTPGYSLEERSSFDNLLTAGFTDTFRTLNASAIKYSYWSAYHKSRENNVGWRIDYVIASDSIKDKLVNADILNDYYGSDHCPVIADIDIDIY